MSAFVFCLHRQGKPVSKELFAPMMDAINVFGIDGKQQIIQNNFAFGYQRFWTTPEEVGEKQPLQDREINTWLVFDGRIDNRQEIYDLLNNKRHKLLSLSDARLFLELYKQTGKKHIGKIIGSFVFVMFNEKTNEIFAGRDAMGGRHLVYKITNQWVVLATFEIAVAKHKDFEHELNEQRIVEYFASLRPKVPSTCIKDVIQLQPGFELSINKYKVDIKSRYLIKAEQRICYSNSDRYAEEFKEILQASVNARLRSVSPISSMTSGGLDSLPMSVIAAESLKRKGEKLNAISWVFDNYKESDERKYIEPMAKKYEFNSIYVNCDSEWPLKKQWTINPTVPFSTPYRTFHNLAYKKNNEISSKVMLSGMGGDLLYVGWEMQIYELAKQGRLIDAFQELQRRVKRSNSTMHCLKMHLLWPTMLYKKTRGKIANKKATWLTDEAKDMLKDDKHWLLDEAQKAIRPGQYWRLLDTFEGEDAASERYYCAQYGFEMRYPYRDRRLVEFMLQIPTEQLFFNNVPRIVMRRAMKNRLTKQSLARRGKASFRNVFRKGMLEQADLINRYAYQSNQEWLKYVKSEYINNNCNEYNLRLMLKWMCAYFQYWKDKATC